MKQFVIILTIAVSATLTQAGPSCCPLSSKNKKASVKNSSAAIQASAAECSLEDMGKYFKSGKEISTDDLKALLTSKPDILLVDSRTPEWDDGKRIADAKNLTPESTEKEIQDELTSKDSFIVTYCGSVKCPLSHSMAARLKGLGYTNTLVYPDGIAGWISAGNSVN